jgi:anti-sigma factor RsiW
MQRTPFSAGCTYAMSREPLRDDQLIRHLLGTLPEDEAQRVEEETIVDDEVAARLQVAEDDLVDVARGGP